MEKLAIKLTDYILSKDAISEENYDIYVYGFTCFLELSISFISTFIIGICLGMFFEVDFILINFSTVIYCPALC